MVGVRSTSVHSRARMVSARDEKSEVGVVMQTVAPCCTKTRVRCQSRTRRSDGKNAQRACPRCS